ncbi:MAG: phosphate ABC transporter substrate-binding protein [Treponemataceae bacterium]
MKNLKKILFIVLALGLLFSCDKKEETTTSATEPVEEQKPELTGSVSTNGSTSMASVINSLAEAFMDKNPGVNITYDPTGSGTGVESVDSGTADIGLASRDLKDGEKANGLKSTVLALDGIAIIANENCTVDDISLDTLGKVFRGEIKNWSEVGGESLPIACIGREAGSGTRDGFESITKTKGECKLQSELTSTGAVISSVANNKNAIGYASLSAIENQKGIKVLTIDGVAASEATVKNGTYKIQRPLNLVTKEGRALSEVAQAFFDFATSGSPETTNLIKKAGVVPAK